MDDRAVHSPSPDGIWGKLLVQKCHFNYFSVATYAQLKKYISNLIWWRNVSYSDQPFWFLVIWQELRQNICVKGMESWWGHQSHEGPNTYFMFTQQRTRVFVSCIIILFDLNITQYFYNNYIHTTFNFTTLSPQL